MCGGPQKFRETILFEETKAFLTYHQMYHLNSQQIFVCLKDSKRRCNITKHICVTTCASGLAKLGCVGKFAI